MISGIDLYGLALALRAQDKHPALVRRIMQTTSAASAFQDLQSAHDTMEELRLLTLSRLKPEAPSKFESLSAAALFAYAVILYARATETKPIDRWKWFSADSLTEGQRRWHHQVMDHRNKVLAHFGHGSEESEGPTVRQALIMSPVDRGMAFTFFETRAHTRAGLSAKLALLIERTRELARARYDEGMKALFEELKAGRNADPTLAPYARTFAFDASEFIPDDVMMMPVNEDGDLQVHFAKRGDPSID